MRTRLVAAWFGLFGVWPLAPWDLHERHNGITPLLVADYLAHFAGAYVALHATKKAPEKQGVNSGSP